MAPFAFRMARREWRFALRRLGVYMTSISIGVAALVALHSFRNDVVRSIEEDNKSLLGADARLSANRELPDSVNVVLDSLVALGAQVSRVTSLSSMALAERSGRTRLVRLRGVEPGFPFYGAVETRPRGLWERLDELEGVLVDPPLLVQLGAEPGDTLLLGEARAPILGTVEGLPTDIGLQAAAGPRVFAGMRLFAETELLAFGSLARYRAYVRLPAELDADEIEEAQEDVLRAADVSFRTPLEQARSLTRSTDFLADFLGLVGLAALLLGGVGVGSAVNVYVRGKLTPAAVLLCLGATRRQVFSTYLLQATGMGLLGAAVGVAGGVALQRFLPPFVGDVLPVEVTPEISVAAVGFGLFLGAWVAFVFALLPLLGVRRVSPLQALRHFAEAPPRRDWARAAALVALAVTVLALTVYEAPTPLAGVAFAVALAAGTGVLWCVAAVLVRATRRFFPKWAGYAMRQGIANLFRPGNQTVAVVLALGSGVFVVGAISQLQRNMMRELSVELNAADLIVFDVQPDQEEDVARLIAKYSEAEAELAPMVTTRIGRINGRTVADILADTAAGDRPSRWALRNEYRSTFRRELRETETIVAGEWWGGVVPADAAKPRVSLAAGVAEDLRVDVGDEITWRLGGGEVASTVSSLREVDWNDFDMNFFAVFEPGTLDDAPRTSIATAKVPGDSARAEFQETLVRNHPNVSVLDLLSIRETVESVLDKALGVVGLLTALCSGAGLVVMAGAMASTRAQRAREGALLRVLGGRVRQIRLILLSEYAALGSLAAAAGGALSVAASWLLSRHLFEMRYVPAFGPALLLWLAVAGLAVLVGIASGRRRDGRGPLAVLRESGD